MGQWTVKWTYQCIPDDGRVTVETYLGWISLFFYNFYTGDCQCKNSLKQCNSSVISFNSLTNKRTFNFLTSIHPTYVSTYSGHHQGYTDIVTSLFTHSLGINIERYAVYNNWQSPIAVYSSVTAVLIYRFCYTKWMRLFCEVSRDCQLL
jgi:hypothetical protein